MSSSHQGAKVLELQHWPFQWILISFRMDWLDLLAVQGTLKSLLQCHSSKASILWHSAFFIVQLSYPYMTTWKTMLLLLSLFSHVWLCAIPQMAAHQALLSLGFSRQEHWSRLPFNLESFKKQRECELCFIRHIQTPGLTRKAVNTSGLHCGDYTHLLIKADVQDPLRS